MSRRILTIIYFGFITIIILIIPEIYPFLSSIMA